MTTAPAKMGAMMDVTLAQPLLMPMSILAKLGARSRWFTLKPMKMQQLRVTATVYRVMASVVLSPANATPSSAMAPPQCAADETNV